MRGSRTALLAFAPRGGRAARTVAALLLAGALLAPGRPASGAAGDPRTLVVRGRVLAPDGTPVAGARVSARGSATTLATSDDRGRYSLTVPIGSAAGLRRGAFTLDVRAERDGRRLALGTGASALAIEVALAAGGGRVRVRSNSQAATTAIATAFAQDGLATAWVEADFGGASRPGGPPVLDAVDEVALDGSPAFAPRESAVAAPAASSHVRAAPGAGAARPAGSARVARATDRPATRRPAVADRDPALARVAPPSRVTVTVAPAPAAAPGSQPAPPPATPRVVRAPERADGADSCACRVRGTVEVDWERPLDRDFPVELTLEGPATQRIGVDMFIGSPREFRFGPLPCGEYRLAVQSHGRVHFALERGDSVLTVSCHGLTQARVVLVPARR